MNLFSKKLERVKNQGAVFIKKDFTYNAFSFLILGFFLFLGVMALKLGGQNLSIKEVAIFCDIVLGIGVLIAIFPLWIMNIIGILACWIIETFYFDYNLIPLSIAASVGILLSASIELVYQWDKVVILRTGKFKAVHSAGFFFLMPLIDRVAAYVDTRIKVTDFSAGKAITKDTVPVNVDALCFWMVWDPQKAILEVENFEEAVSLSAQTALRDGIGRNDLSVLLSDRERLGQEIQKVLEAKTNDWGITVLSIEFTDVIIPKDLENAMSKKAQAEREKQSRIILGEAEKEIAKQYAEAAQIYDGDKDAIQLRAMNMVYEGIRNNGSLMLLPSSALDSMNLGTTMGVAGLKNSQKQSVPPKKDIDKTDR